MEERESSLLFRYQVLLEMAEQIPGLHVDKALVETYMLFLQSASRVFVAQQAFYERFELSEGKVVLLLLLYRAPDYRLTPSALAEAASVTRGTVTGLLAGLERSGLVKRTVHPEDGRMVAIELTAEALTLIEQMLPERFQRIQHFLSALSQEEQEQLRCLLAKMAGNLATLHRP
jgi:DNA-binding MarR family transcriptional regulator